MKDMGRKKIRNPYDGRKHVVTVRLKYWEHQELCAFATKAGMTVSDVCRVFVKSGIANWDERGEHEAERDALQEKIPDCTSGNRSSAEYYKGIKIS